MAFTTDPIFVVKEICDLLPVPDPRIKRVVFGQEADAGCSSNTRFFLIATNDQISPNELEVLRQELRRRVEQEQFKCPPTTQGGQTT